LLRVIVAKTILLFFFKKNIFRRKVLIVGCDQTGMAVYRNLKKDEFNEFDVVGFLDDYKPVGYGVTGSYQNLGKLRELKNICQVRRIDEIIIAIDNTPYERLITIVESCLKACNIVRIHSNFLEVVAKKIKVEYYSNIPVMMLSQYEINSWNWRIKYLTDRILAGVLIILIAPLLIFISIAIKLSSEGPVIYRQTRIGKGGQPFQFYKFRSMYINNDDTEHENFVREVWFNQRRGNRQKDITVYRITNDPRVFPFGRLIRKTSLDELPQLFNVLKGDMSLVGPRPCMPFEWDMYKNWHKNRLNIRPGCTGLWQATGRATVSFEEMVILDLYYISNMTLWFDLKILVMTIPVIFLAKGGY
jgi:exopolysaccharide biosynthesis polyprenyl glycosylphosphotransferase